MQTVASVAQVATSWQEMEHNCWRCPRYGCQSVISMREGSFFTGSHLKLHEIMEISYWWASETSVSKTIQQTGHSSRTIVDRYNIHRDVCAQWFLDDPVQAVEQCVH